jgi:hypothetical protein
MKVLLKGVAVAALALALVACSHGNRGPSADQAGGVSKPGVAGAPGGKSGPTATSSGSSSAPAANSTQLQDQSKVQGLPGGKSGATVRSPSK